MELGSEYNLSLAELNIVPDNIFEYLSEFAYCYYFDSGRSALRHIARYISSYNKILLPEFICESVTNCFDNRNLEYYRLKEDFSVDIDNLLKHIENKPTVIFLMHYFGSIQPLNVLEKIHQIAEKSGSIIIEDTTHSIFSQKRTVGDYIICSIRKWLPISGGGVLYYNQDPLYLSKPDYQKSTDNYRSYGMILKDLFLNQEFDCNSEYRRIFCDSEAKLDKQREIYEISDFSKYIASCISVERIIKRRRCNFQQLNEALKVIGLSCVVNFDAINTPFVYTVRIKNRDAFRSYLMNNKVYCAVHWSFDNHKQEQRPFAKRNAEELISLPIDQRYDSESIKYLIDMVLQYGGDLLF